MQTKCTIIKYTRLCVHFSATYRKMPRWRTPNRINVCLCAEYGKMSCTVAAFTLMTFLTIDKIGRLPVLHGCMLAHTALHSVEFVQWNVCKWHAIYCDKYDKTLSLVCTENSNRTVWAHFYMMISNVAAWKRDSNSKRDYTQIERWTNCLSVYRFLLMSVRI